MLRLVGRDDSHKLFLCRRAKTWKEKRETFTLTITAANKQATAPEPSPTPTNSNKAACVANNTDERVPSRTVTVFTHAFTN